jgi:hypothetical protein
VTIDNPYFPLRVNYRLYAIEVVVTIDNRSFSFLMNYRLYAL